MDLAPTPAPATSPRRQQCLENNAPDLMEAVAPAVDMALYLSDDDEDDDFLDIPILMDIAPEGADSHGEHP